MADDDNASNDSVQGQGSDDTSSNTTDATGASGDQQDTSSNGTQGDDMVSRDELMKLDARMRAADKRATEAENKLKEIERKDQSELERAQGDLQEAQQTISTLTEQLNAMALQNAFLSDNKHSWVDPSDALKLLDMEGVEVKDGKVSGLAPAIEKLAKAKPHLLKPEAGKSGDGSSSGASGSANNGKRKGDDSKAGKPNYKSRFPALNK